ncbi:hypothetical protein [Cellulophaga baltica]|uniref:Uncharacterized protein n=1 Tax=Cellulophaga baltica TaxID=76594 RepID=A0A1G7HKQ0_9FLAO|nr:hypothetical protein [Cellulophaga baltica]SDF00931.1 hypothetical protein SAMN04487992_106133 [Cellulophaga baltica]
MIEQLIFGGIYNQNNNSDLSYTKDYGITIKFHQKKQLDEIRYKMNITCSKKAGSLTWEVTLNKTALYVNNKIPDFLKPRLDLKFGTGVLYPITVMVSPFGTIKNITGTSYSSIIDRFKYFKEKTLQENSGDAILNYLNTLEKGINTQKKLIDYLMYDWFWALYFNPIYNNTTKELLLPLRANVSAVFYEGKIEEKIYLSYYNTRQRIFSGKVSNTYFEKYSSTKRQNAAITLCYDFDPTNGVITNISSDQVILENQNILQNIEVSIDQLSKNEN